MRSDNAQEGYTLVELMVVLVIIGVLTALAVPSYIHFRNQAKKATCLSHMKTVHTGLGAHLNDKGYWPQMPDGIYDGEETDFFEFWIRAIEPYGVHEPNWLCPADKVRKEAWDKDKSGSYIPTPFDAHPISPIRWNQPWLIERGNLHGKGAHIAMPDGSINPSMSPFGGIR